MAEPTILVGKSYDDGYEGRIDSDAATAYALATNDPNPIYLRGGVVPPLYTASLVQPAFADAEAGSIEPGAIGGDPRASVHVPLRRRIW